MQTNRKQAIAVILILAAGLVFSNPQKAFALFFTQTSASYWESTNTDTPGGWPYSQASHGGSLTDNISGSTYNLQAVSSAFGYIYGGFGTVGGVLICGLGLGVLEALGAGYLSSAYQHGYAFVILIIVLTFLPKGLFGKM